MLKLQSLQALSPLMNICYHTVSGREMFYNAISRNTAIYGWALVQWSLPIFVFRLGAAAILQQRSQHQQVAAARGNVSGGTPILHG